MDRGMIQFEGWQEDEVGEAEECVVTVVGVVAVDEEVDEDPPLLDRVCVFRTWCEGSRRLFRWLLLLLPCCCCCLLILLPLMFGNRLLTSGRAILAITRSDPFGVAESHLLLRLTGSMISG